MSPRRALGSREGLASPEDSIFSQWVNEWTSYPPHRNLCTNTNALHPVTELIWLQSFKGRWSWTHLRIWWKLPAPNVNRILHSTSEISWTTEFNVKDFWSLIQSSSFTNVPREQKWLAQDHIAGKKKKKKKKGRKPFLSCKWSRLSYFSRSLIHSGQRQSAHSSRAGLFYFKVLCLGIEMHLQKFLLDQNLPRLGLRFGEEKSCILIFVCVGRVRGQWFLLLVREKYFPLSFSFYCFPKCFSDSEVKQSSVLLNRIS